MDAAKWAELARTDVIINVENNTDYPIHLWPLYGGHPKGLTVIQIQPKRKKLVLSGPFDQNYYFQFRNSHGEYCTIK